MTEIPTLSPKEERVNDGNPNPLPLGGEGGESSEPGEGVLHLSPYYAKVSRTASGPSYKPPPIGKE